MRPKIAAVAAAVIVASATGTLRADQLISQGMSPVQVTIHDFKESNLVYSTARGDETRRPYERVQQLVVDGETALNTAEIAFSDNKKDASVDNYIKAIRATNKPWVKLFAARRLGDAVGDQGRFDARLAAYLAGVTADPATGRPKPQLPEADSRYLDSAVVDVEAALKTPGLGDAQKIALMNFLTDIHRRRSDTAAATAVLERLSKIAGDGTTDPAVIAELTNLKVAQAKAAIDQKNYAQAVKLINDVRPMLSDPVAQSDALMVLARATLATADKTDKPAMQDAALAFMRVVAHFDDVDGKPNVQAALQQTADILEQIGDEPGTIAALTQIGKEFPNTPAATAAGQKLQRLKKG